MQSLEEKIKNTVRDVPNFPKEGILFKDITPVLHNPSLCDEITTSFATQLTSTPVDAVVGIESRGFLFGFALATKLNVPFILIRKAGKLPYKTISCEYQLEYGKAVLELQEGEIKPNWNVLIHDDLLATGGTAEAAAKLIRMQQGTVAGFSFVIGLDFLKGRLPLKQFSDTFISLVHY
jgi:adenine phosphoribosyltransferase